MFSLTPALRAFEQLTDPLILRVLLHSLGLTILAFVLLLVAGAWGLHAAFGLLLWWHAGLLGGVAAALMAYLLFVPVVTGIAALFADQIADAVERRWYAGLPPPQGASLAAQSWDSLALAGRVLVAHLFGLVCLLLLPGLGVLLGWAIGAWAVGRGLFVVVAMRRASRPGALALYQTHRLRVLLYGALLTAMSLVPLLSLLVPVLGIAMMIHLLHESSETISPDIQRRFGNSDLGA